MRSKKTALVRESESVDGSPGRRYISFNEEQTMLMLVKYVMNKPPIDSEEGYIVAVDSCGQLCEPLFSLSSLSSAAL